MRYSASTHIPRPKFVMNNSNWVYLYLPLMLVVSKWNCFEARTAAQGYDIAPGHTYVLNNVTITLPWASSIQENYIIFCNWQHLFPGATGWDRFVGYDNVKKTRLEHSYRHVGWEFTNTDHPCLGGLSRQNVQPDYEGIYQMVIMDQDQQRFEANGHVTVVRDKEVQYKIIINEDVYNLTLHDAVPTPPDLAANVGEHVNVQVELEDNFPPSNITVSQHSRPVIRCLVVAICTGYVSYSESDKIESFEIRIDPDIQGAQSVTLKQTVSVTSASSPSQSTAVVITIVVTLIILAIIIAMCVLVGWKQGWMKCKREKPKSFIVETPSCIKGSHHSLQEQTPLNIEESQMIAVVDVNTQFEPLYGKLQEDVEKLLKRENDTSSKYQRQIDSFVELSNTVEAEEMTLNQVLSDLSVTHTNAGKLLNAHIEFITRSDDEIKKIRLDPILKNYMTRKMKEAVSSREKVELLMIQCENSNTFLLETLQPEFRQIDTDIELCKNITQCQQNTFSDICDNCRRTDPAVVSSRHDVLQPDSEDEKQLSKQKLKTQISEYSNLYEASIRLREVLDELKDTPTNKHEKYDQVNNRIEEAQRKCSAQDMKSKNFNNKLTALNNDFNKMCNDSRVA